MISTEEEGFGKLVFINLLNFDSKIWHFIFCQESIGLKQFWAAFQNCCLDTFTGHKKYLSAFLPRNHISGIVSMLLSLIFFSDLITENILTTLLFESCAFILSLLSHEKIPEKLFRHILHDQAKSFISIPTPAHLK